MSIVSSSFTPNAKPFTPGGFKAPVEVVKPREPTPPPRDVIVDQFAKWTHSERETNDFKDIIKKLAERKSSEPITLDVFKTIQALEIGLKHEDLNFCTNGKMIERSIKHMVESKKGNFRQGGQKGGNRDNNRGEGNFNKNQYPKTPKTGGGGGGGDFKKPGLWREEDVGEKNKLKLIAQKNHENAKKDKNDNQKIRLILNIIAPDNYTKKFGELRGYLFPNLKKREECDEEEVDYDEEAHKL